MINLKEVLDKRQDLQRYLFNKGFLITDRDVDLSGYPFYGNWRKERINGINFYIHNEVRFYYKNAKDQVLFLIGHAYNPFSMEMLEDNILSIMSELNAEKFWEYEANLTGVYVMGILTPNRELIHWSDCAGMRISYYGHIDNHYYVTSHTNIVASLCSLEEDRYIVDLKKSKFFRLFGNVLPSDYSCYAELKRTVPNHTYSSNANIQRFYPINEIIECKDEDEYQEVLHEASIILKNTLNICAKKWCGERIAISVTGGKDSGETLSSANNNYDKFTYFSYISKPEEKIDAEAARKICNKLGLKHRIIDIPDVDVEDFDIINEIIYINSGSIGYIKPNEVRKRSVLIRNAEIDVEIKSWVNEITRAYWYKKYHTMRFPERPNGRYLATLYKVFIHNRILFHKTSNAFNHYIHKYMNTNDLELVNDWTTLWSWEFGFSAGEGQSLIAEHMLSFDVTIPFNNRHLISLMLRPRLEDRINDRLQRDIISVNNPVQAALNIDVVNAAHTKKRARMEKAYLIINTHLPL